MRPFIKPLPIRANDPCVLVRGRPLETPFRLIAEENYQHLLDLIALADETIIDLHGAYPLDPGKLQQTMGLIRQVSGQDYDDRKIRATRALEDW